MKINEYLKQRRLELGMTLNDVAQRVGVNNSTISRWESGDIKDMKRNAILKYAEALQISPAIIMGWEDPEEIQDIKEQLKDSYLTKDEQELLEAFRALGGDRQARLLAYAYLLNEKLK